MGILHVHPRQGEFVLYDGVATLFYVYHWPLDSPSELFGRLLREFEPMSPILCRRTQGIINGQHVLNFSFCLTLKLTSTLDVFRINEDEARLM